MSEVATEYEECLPSCEGVFITQVQTGSVGNSEKLQGLMSKGRVQKFLLNRLVESSINFYPTHPLVPLWTISS